MITYIGINGRKDIPRFLNEEGLKGVGVEIGTHLGEYAEHILRHWHGQKLICVDPWEEAIDYDDQIPLLWGGSDRLVHRLHAESRLSAYVHHGKCKIWQTTSDQATRNFQNDTLDFVYIDGNHKFGHVLADLQLWWRCIKPGGYIFGHDIVCPGEIGWAAHIQPAVMMFTRIFEVDYSLIPESDPLPWSYAIRKPL